LEKEPELRYQQAKQVKTDVETIAAADDRPPGSSQSAPLEHARAWMPHRMRRLLLTAGTLAAASSLAWVWLQTRLPRSLAPIAVSTQNIVLRLPGKQAELLDTSVAAVSQFGPVVERVISLSEGDLNCLDLDSGVLQRLPRTLISRRLDRDQLSAWGVDVFYNPLAKKIHILDMATLAWDAEGWNVPAQQITDIFGRNAGRMNREEREIVPGPSYAFRTRDGATGLLQLEQSKAIAICSRSVSNKCNREHQRCFPTVPESYHDPP
jgi:hypothetical protein